jgi:glycosyltransferase involved in cell wall biosynthesis
VSEPEVSVVIPTRNRETRLRFGLEALAAQTVERRRFEVIVVRANDMEGPFCEPPPELNVTFLEAPPGPALQRNVGWRAARGKLIAFTDDDCRATPEWLESLLASSAGPEDMLQGRTAPDPAEVHLLNGRARSIDIDAVDAWYPTCNIAYPRALLERLGGFDEDFPTAWGEDTDLGLRAIDAGATVFFEPGALSYHAVNARTLRQAIREAYRRDSLPMVFARHPRQRRALFLDTFVRRTHANLTLAIVGLVIFRHHPLLGFFAMLPYLRNRRPLKVAAVKIPQIIVHLPARVAVDATEMFATGRAAIRHRVPVV